MIHKANFCGDGGYRGSYFGWQLLPKGCRGYGGKLNIRPTFQREFVYNETQRDAVIRTVKSGFPLNVMYWRRDV